MSVKLHTIASAVAALLAIGAAERAAAATQVKCYGVAKAGQNDCAANGHSCAGQARIDNDPAEWKGVKSAERCAQLGGSLAPPAQAPKPADPVVNPPIIVDD
jgi:uncharacterized membrane protein